MPHPPNAPASARPDSRCRDSDRYTKEALSQSKHVRGRINRYQGSSSIDVFSVVEQLAKDTELFTYKMTLICKEVRTFRKTNKALTKRRKVKKTRVRIKGAFSIEDAFNLIK